MKDKCIGKIGTKERDKNEKRLLKVNLCQSFEL